MKFLLGLSVALVLQGVAQGGDTLTGLLRAGALCHDQRIAGIAFSSAERRQTLDEEIALGACASYMRGGSASFAACRYLLSTSYLTFDEAIALASTPRTAGAIPALTAAAANRIRSDDDPAVAQVDALLTMIEGHPEVFDERTFPVAVDFLATQLPASTPQLLRAMRAREDYDAGLETIFARLPELDAYREDILATMESMRFASQETKVRFAELVFENGEDEESIRRVVDYRVRLGFGYSRLHAFEAVLFANPKRANSAARRLIDTASGAEPGAVAGIAAMLRGGAPHYDESTIAAIEEWARREEETIVARDLIATLGAVAFRSDGATSYLRELAAGKDPGKLYALDALWDHPTVGAEIRERLDAELSAPRDKSRRCEACSLTDYSTKAARYVASRPEAYHSDFQSVVKEAIRKARYPDTAERDESLAKALANERASASAFPSEPPSVESMPRLLAERGLSYCVSWIHTRGANVGEYADAISQYVSGCSAYELGPELRQLLSTAKDPAEPLPVDDENIFRLWGEEPDSSAAAAAMQAADPRGFEEEVAKHLLGKSEYERNVAMSLVAWRQAVGQERASALLKQWGFRLPSEVAYALMLEVAAAESDFGAFSARFDDTALKPLIVAATADAAVSAPPLDENDPRLRIRRNGGGKFDGILSKVCKPELSFGPPTVDVDQLAEEAGSLGLESAPDILEGIAYPANEVHAAVCFRAVVGNAVFRPYAHPFFAAALARAEEAFDADYGASYMQVQKVAEQIGLEESPLVIDPEFVAFDANRSVLDRMDAACASLGSKRRREAALAYLGDVLMNHPDARLRARAAWIMGIGCDTRGESLARNSLVAGLGDADPSVRRECAFALVRGEYYEGEVVSILQEALRDGTWPGRWSMMSTLARGAGRKTFGKTIAELAADPDPLVATQARYLADVEMLDLQ